MSSTLQGLLTSPLLLITLTLSACWFGRLVYKRFNKFALLHPMIISLVIIISFLKLTGVEYETYYSANQPINFFLGVSVVALGYLLYEEFKYIKGNTLSIMTAVFMGSLVGVLAVIALSMLFKTSSEIMFSMQPKSVTMPIALVVSDAIGGDPALTSLGVLTTGLLGSIFGPWFLKVIRVTDPVAKGLAMGSAAHALGTARAMEDGAIEGAVGGLAIAIMGVMTAIVIPILKVLIG